MEGKLACCHPYFRHCTRHLVKSGFLRTDCPLQSLAHVYLHMHVCIQVFERLCVVHTCKHTRTHTPLGSEDLQSVSTLFPYLGGSRHGSGVCFILFSFYFFSFWFFVCFYQFVQSRTKLAMLFQSTSGTSASAVLATRPALGRAAQCSCRDVNSSWWPEQRAQLLHVLCSWSTKLWL